MSWRVMPRSRSCTLLSRSAYSRSRSSPELSTLIPKPLMSAGASNAALGLVAACYAGGFLAGAILSPRQITRIGHIRSFSFFAALAIIASLIITTLLYAGVTVTTVRAVPIEDLAASERPLALVFEAGGGPIALLSAIAVIAALNGVLAQVVMAARVLFGLGKSGGVLSVFRHAHPRFGTPVLATVLIGVCVIGAALALPVSNLAGVTSTILLLVFTLVNASLILLKRSRPKAPFCIAPWVPWVGLVFALLALAAFALGGAV